jgi:hypothetical protein
MTTLFSRSDKKFLRSVGISTEPTFAEERLALAKRIAKHQAPLQVKLEPEAAKRQLIRLAVEKLLMAKFAALTTDDLEFLQSLGIAE